MPAQYRLLIKCSFWGALIFSYIAAIVPQDTAPAVGELSDKILHFMAFSLLSLLLMLSYRIQWWKSVVYLSGYAVFIELSQSFTPNRCADWMDVAADMIGIAAGLIVYSVYRKLEALRADS
ncbi:VanZ family protein [Sulfurovum sp. ST-21]|uniref:VanZ family protein n=1 Tax=Sulfurovum indicum TaxID=2779528 RepID=A0A7M1S894_9BACT|nr:VanZ family protein [Sulfurovum indicum]QOR62560.1 VanZ family protein [Sulfurovum indicum]